MQCQHGAPEPTPYLLAIALAHGDHSAGVFDYPLLACLGILVLTSEATRGTRRRCLRRRASRRCRCRSNFGSEPATRPPAASDAAAEKDDMQRLDIQPGKGDTTWQGQNCQGQWNVTSWHHNALGGFGKTKNDVAMVMVRVMGHGGGDKGYDDDDDVDDDDDDDGDDDDDEDGSLF